MKILSLCLVSLILVSCGKDCKNLTYHTINGKAVEYFGMYKPNNWWVYKNQNNTKKDSVYVVGYSIAQQKDSIKSACNINDYRDYKLKSEFLNQNKTFLYRFRSLGDDRAYYEIFENTYPSSNVLYNAASSIGYYNTTNSFFSERDIYLQNIRLNNRQFDSIVRYSLVYDTGKYATYCIAKGLGIVGWHNQTDTFHLSHYQIL